MQRFKCLNCNELWDVRRLFTGDRFLMSMIRASDWEKWNKSLEAFGSSETHDFRQTPARATENPAYFAGKKAYPNCFTRLPSQQKKTNLNYPIHVQHPISGYPATDPINSTGKARINVPVEALRFSISGEVEGTQDATSVCAQGWGSGFSKLLANTPCHLGNEKIHVFNLQSVLFFLETKTIIISSYFPSAQLAWSHKHLQSRLHNLQKVVLEYDYKHL